MVGSRNLIAALALLAVSATGCSTQQIARFESKVATSRCAKAGLAEGSAEHQQCITNYLGAADQERATNQAVLLGIAGAAAQARAMEQQGPAAASYSPYGDTAYRLTRFWWNAGKRMCEYSDGSILNVGHNQCPASVTAPR